MEEVEGFWRRRGESPGTGESELGAWPISWGESVTLELQECWLMSTIDTISIV